MSKVSIYAVLLALSLLACAASAAGYEIGAYYYPGWDTVYSKNWPNISGTPGTKNPGRSWPEREPLIGYYPEEQPWVADKQLEQASSHGIDFFVYEWFWGVANRQPNAEHAIKNHLQSRHKDKVRFCVMWANHWQLPDQENYEAMVRYWVERYFTQSNYYRIEGKPVVFLFSPEQFATNAAKFGKSARELLELADAIARSKGLKGIYFVAETMVRPADVLEAGLRQAGYSAYTGWNYVAAEDKSPSADYGSMVDTYLNFYRAAARTSGSLPYIATASPGWDASPLKGNKPFVYVRENATPAKFKKMLLGAKKLMDSRSGATAKILVVEAWNEYGEGSYIEPTKKWGFQYLEAIRDVFGK